MRKTIIALLLGFALFATFSCNKDDDDNNKPSIVGKWYVQSESTQFYIDGELDTDTSATYSGNSYYFEFSSNTTLTVKDPDGIVTTGTYAYNPDSNKVTLTIDNTAIAYDVKKLTSSELSLYADQTLSDGTFTYRIVDAIEMKK